MDDLEKQDLGLAGGQMSRRGFLGRSVAATVMMSGAGVLLDACSTSASSSTSQTLAKTITLGQVGDFTSFDPASGTLIPD